MHSFFSSRLIFAGAFLLATASLADPAPEAGATIKANVGPLRTTQGSVACRLFKSGDGFPQNSSGTITRRVKVTGAVARCTFDKLPPGTYAVMVHHDENDNKKFDKNFLGMPLEGYGASNNHTPALSAPTWEASRFVVERGKTRELTIALRY
jgi:uncharacterized protein (DUF2141 family)